MIRVTAGIIEESGRILIARRGADDALAGKWEFPGGKIEPGEEPEDCLQRELREELGIDVRVGRLAGTEKHSSPRGDVELLFYEVDHVSGDMRPLAHAEVAWVLPREMMAYELAPADRDFAARHWPLSGG